MKARLAIQVIPICLGLAACGSPFDIPDNTDLRTSGVAVGHEHTCTLAIDGAAHCWGWGDLGQLGDGAMATSRLPKRVLGNLRLARLDAGSFHSCGLLDNGEAYCWGSRHAGELGDGQSLGVVGEPQRVLGDLRFQAISVGDGHTCALDLAGRAYCWGLGATGQLGTGEIADRSLPATVEGGHSFRRISAGFHVTCGISTGGEGYCWGDNQWGMLGTGSIGGVAEEPEAISGGLNLETIAVGSFIVCGLTTDGAAYCWGSGSFGRLGTGDGSEATQPTPQRVAGGLMFASLSVGDTHTCGVTTGDAAYCWGLNTYGKLGSAAGALSGVPVLVNGGHAFVQVGVGTFHTCGVTRGNEAFCWGNNFVGQLGVPGISERTTDPVLVIFPAVVEDAAVSYPLR